MKVPVAHLELRIVYQQISLVLCFSLRGGGQQEIIQVVEELTRPFFARIQWSASAMVENILG